MPPKLTEYPIRIAILLFLFLNFTYLLTSTGKARSIDEIDPVMQSESLLLHHTTAIPQALNSGIYFGKVDRNQIPRSAWPFGHAALILPWSAAGHALVAHSNGIPHASADLVISTFTCWSNATYAALAAAAAFLIFFRLIGNTREAVLCALVLAFSSALFVYSGWLFSEPATTALFVIAVYLLFGTPLRPSIGRTFAAALLLAFSIHIRPANMVTVFVFLAASAVHDFYPCHPERSEAESMDPYSDRGLHFRTTLILLVIIGISGTLYLIRNYQFFGNPFDFGVPPTAENGKDLESWHNPFWRGVFGFLFSPGKSVFLFSPPIIVGILGLPALWRRSRALTVLAIAAPVANLCLYSFRTQWEGSYCYGPRYLLPSLVLLCLPIAALFRERPHWLRPVFWTTTILGFAVQVIGLSTNVLEDMVSNHYYNQNWDYQMSYAPIPGQLQLIWEYLHAAPTQIGLGWDRWFLLWQAAGVSPALTTTFVALFMAAALTFALLTWRSLKTTA